MSSSQRSLVLAASLLSLTGCRAIEGIFKAGMWVGVVVVVLLVALVAGVARMLSR